MQPNAIQDESLKVAIPERVDWRAQAERDAEFRVARERFDRAPVMHEVRRLSRVDGWRSARVIGWQWVCILGAATLAIVSGHWAVYIAAAIVIASRAQCLGVLMHDGAHYLLFRSRLVNDIVSDLFLAFPLGLSTTLYRHDHFIHHRFTQTDRDPDIQLQNSDEDFRWPKSRRACAWLLIRSLCGLNLHRTMRATMHWSPWPNLFRRPGRELPIYSRILLVTTTLAVYSFFYLSGLIVPVLLLAVIPAFTLLNFSNRVRVTAEHMGVPADHELNSTRTVIPNWLERLFIAPYGVNYHIEHHLFPSVPGIHLKELHRTLMTDDHYRQHAHVTKSYSGLLRELMAPRTNDTAAPKTSLSP